VPRRPLHADTAVPYVTLLDAAQLVHTGRNLLVVNRSAANGFYTRGIDAHSHEHQSGQGSAQAAAAAPAVVNGYPRADDDGDCPVCHEPITMLTGVDRLGSLLVQVNAHRCAPGPRPETSRHR
jgi:hypothetical protein